VVDDPLPVQAPGDARAVEQVRRALLEHAGADPRLAVLAAPPLEDDRVDPGHVQQAGEREPGRACAHDPDLRAELLQPSSARTRCATANAPFAAGTPQ
jgi:hypothetical protein